MRSRPPNLPWRGRESRGSAAALIAVGILFSCAQEFSTVLYHRLMSFVRAPPNEFQWLPADFEPNWKLKLQLGVCHQLGHILESLSFQSM